MPTLPLDPRRDCALIARDLARVAFSWDTTRALELALFRTFASPRIGGLLHATAEFEARPQKRYDDTDLIISEIIEYGYDGERGRRAIDRMNAIHALLDPALLTAFDLEPAPRWLRSTTAAALRTRARLLRWVPKPRRVRLRTEIPRADYPNGYRIESLGPSPHGD